VSGESVSHMLPETKEVLYGASLNISHIPTPVSHLPHKIQTHHLIDT